MTMRIVSLLASGTEIVDALGLGDRMVGISHECDFPEHLLSLPRLSRPRFDPNGLSSGEIDAAVRRAMEEHGSVYEIDAGALEALRPDIILSQAVCEVCAVPTGGVREAVAASGLDTTVVSLDAHTIDEIFDSMRQVGIAAGAELESKTRIAELETRLARVEADVSGAPKPRVLGIEWLSPPFAPGHWVPEMIERAGGQCLVGETGRPSQQLEWADFEDLDPDALLIMPCGYDLDGARADADAHAEQLRRVAPRAIGEGRAWVVDASSYFNRSGPRFVTGVEILGSLLHPDRRPPASEKDVDTWSPVASR